MDNPIIAGLAAVVLVFLTAVLRKQQQVNELKREHLTLSITEKKLAIKQLESQVNE